MHEQLPNGYGCIAIDNVNDDEALSDRLAEIAAEPELAAVVGVRGCAFARARQRDALYPSMLQPVLEAASQRKPIPTDARWRRAGEHPDECRNNVDGSLKKLPAVACPGQIGTAGKAAIKRPIRKARSLAISAGRRLGTSGQAVSLRAGINLPGTATGHGAGREIGMIENEDPLFRLRTERWAMRAGDLEKLLPIRDSRLQIMAPRLHTSGSSEERIETETPANPAPAPVHIVVIDASSKDRKKSLRVDRVTAEILKLSDGTRTALEIAEAVTSPSLPSQVAANLEWIERLFVLGLIGLSDAALGFIAAGQRLRQACHGVAGT